MSEYDDEAKRARFIQNVFDGDEAAFQQWYEQAKTEPPSEEELYRFKKTTFAAKRAAATWASVWESVVGTPFPGWTIEGLEEMAVAADLDFVEWKNGKFSGGEICRRAIDKCDVDSDAQLNATEQAIVEAINELQAEGVVWPEAVAISEKAGYTYQTTKNNLGPMARHGILEKGPSGKGFQVRT